MRSWLVLLAVLGSASVLTMGQSSSGVIYAGQAEVAAAYGQGGGIVVPYESVAAVPEMRIAAGHREAGNEYNVEYHESETETYYIIEGGGTVVTGGTMASDQSRITGGQSHRLSKGDVLIIPPRTPHWWREVTESTNYLTMNIRKP